MTRGLVWTTEDALAAAKEQWSITYRPSRSANRGSDCDVNFHVKTSAFDWLFTRATEGSPLHLKAIALVLIDCDTNNIIVERYRNRARQLIGWRPQFQQLALSERWGVFDTQNGTRVMANGVLSLSQGLLSDDEARDQCAVMARKNDPTALRAIIVVASENRNDGAVVPAATVSPQHIVAAAALRSALELATEVGLFDLLKPTCRQPDSIQDVCDAVVDFSSHTHLGI